MYKYRYLHMLSISYSRLLYFYVVNNNNFDNVDYNNNMLSISVLDKILKSAYSIFYFFYAVNNHNSDNVDYNTNYYIMFISY